MYPTLTAAKDLLGNTPEQIIEPLSAWGWSWRIVVILFLLAVANFLGLIFSGRYEPPTWLFSGFLALVIYPPLLSIFRAIAPAQEAANRLATIGFLVVVAVAFIGIKSFTGHTPNPIPSIGSPLGGLLSAIVIDRFSEGLAGLPMAWTTAIILAAAALIFGAIYSQSNR
ncbi:hypothetical protein ACN08Y_09960 [Rothia sp. P5764]|uniref:hypothetical protein n=1 Tax=Rothia sp. P5764 TaxID=3402654 RepID=UPI003AC6C5BC